MTDNKVPGLPVPVAELELEPLQLNLLEPAPFDNEGFHAALKCVYTLQFSRPGAAPQLWNFFLPNGSLKSAISRGRTFCIGKGYTCIWVKPFLQDLDLLERPPSAPNNPYPLPPINY